MNANQQRVECPRCGHQFELSETFRAHFEAEQKQAVAAAIKRRDEQMEATLREREAAIRAELSQDHQTQQAEQAQQLATLTEQLQAQQAEQAEREAAIRTEAEAAAQEQLAALQRQEEELRQQMQQEQAEWVQQEALIREQVKEDAAQEFALQREQDALERQRLERTVADMQRQLKQGSVELQGEASEVYLKRQLQQHFPFDQIDDIERGQLGADLTQSVYDSRMGSCGIIVWEAKRTKHWNDEWLEKIKGDAERVGAQMRVIVSEALPKDLKIFGMRQGVWVSSIEGALPLAETLRSELVAIAGLQRAEQGKGVKMEEVYRYLASPRFGERIQRMVETWVSLEEQVDKEERAMQRQWKERRKQLAKMQETTIDMFTDISSIMGQEIAQVTALELEALPPGKGDDANERVVES